MRVTRESRPEAPSHTNLNPPRDACGLGGRGFALGGAAFIGIVLSGVVLATRDSPRPLDRTEAGTIASGVVERAIEDLGRKPATSAVVYRQILPSIVAIETKSASPRGHGEGFGTGVVVHTNGTILTAFHVVEAAESIRVTFMDGTRSTAAVAASDPDNDTAVLAGAAAGSGRAGGARRRHSDRRRGVRRRAPAPVCRLDHLRRHLRPRPRSRRARAKGAGADPVRRAVNPGSSSGPLLNRGGQVIGIVTALANPRATALSSASALRFRSAPPAAPHTSHSPRAGRRRDPLRPRPGRSRSTGRSASPTPWSSSTLPIAQSTGRRDGRTRHRGAHARLHSRRAVSEYRVSRG